MCGFVRKISFRRAKFRALRMATVIAALGLCACAVVGPASIDQGRIRYNEVIQETAKQQTLLNIVRVSNGESPLFMDVTEVDAATTIQGAISGGPSALGATPNFKSTSAGTISGAVGFITGAALYQEAPTVRYFPLSGQALIAQVSTPLNAESLADLFDSDWPVASILTLGIDRLTPDYLDYYAALNAIIELDQYGAVIFAATPSSDKEQGSDQEKTSKSEVVTFRSSPPARNDNFTIYFEPEHITVSPLPCDDVGASGKPLAEQKAKAEKIVNALWARLQKIFKVNGSVISISSKGSPVRANEKPQPPLLHARSALGILKDAAEQNVASTIAILRLRKRFGRLSTISRAASARPTTSTRSPWSKFRLTTFQEPELSPNAEKTAAKAAAVQRIYDGQRSLRIMYPEKSILSADELASENYLGSFRKFMLIARSDDPPNDAFVSVNMNGKWYYIFNDDDISKRTLALIAEFDTIQSAPSQSAPLSPSISVGGR